MPLPASALVLLLQGPLLPSMEALVGRFTNPAGPVITALEIQLNGPSAVVYAWAKCEPGDCDWGTADADVFRADMPLSRGGPALSAVFVRDSAEHRLILRATSQGRLAVELLARFPDDSSRNFSALMVLARESLRLAPPAGSLPLRVGGNVREPAKLKDVRPVYPEAAKRDRIQGLVVLECTIGPDGSVVETRPLRGEAQELIDAASEAVRQWRYAPTFVDGVAVPVIMTVTVNFKLS